MNCSAVWGLQLEEEGMCITSESIVLVFKGGTVCRRGGSTGGRPGLGGEAVLLSIQARIVNLSEVDRNVDDEEDVDDI